MYLHLKTSPERAKGHAASPAQGSGGGGSVQNANRVSAAFDVARWGQSPERWRRFHPNPPPTDPSPRTHQTNTPHPATGSQLCGGDGDTVYILVLWMVLLFGWLTASDTLTSIVFSSCEMKWHSCLLALCISLGPVAECSKNSLECGMRHLWNWHWFFFWGGRGVCYLSHFTLLEVLRTSPLFSTSNAVWC